MTDIDPSILQAVGFVGANIACLFLGIMLGRIWMARKIFKVITQKRKQK